MKKADFKKVLLWVSVFVVVVVAAGGGAVADRLFGIKPLDLILPSRTTAIFDRRILNEESAVISVAEKVSPSVVTVSVKLPQRRVLQFSPFGGFSSRLQDPSPQDIGTGFVVSEDGLIVTNKHVVSDAEATYTVILNDDREFEVKQISRDPSNDIAVLKIEASGLAPVELGDSSNLKVGQFVVAIGTALGEFRHTVTTGVISGLGRGIVAGSVYEGYVERLDNVIQTDAAINPGNSGGPLLNSLGQVIGVNVAVAQGAQNVGFAIPINLVKDALEEFKKTGRFLPRAYLGVQYQMIESQTADLNDVPQGAYVIEVAQGSPAEEAGVRAGDIITAMAGVELTVENGGLAEVILKKKPGERVELEIFRGTGRTSVFVVLSEFPQ